MAIDSVYQYSKTEADKAKAIKKADAMARVYKVPFYVGLGTGTFGGYVIANALICDFVYCTDVDATGEVWYETANEESALENAGKARTGQPEYDAVQRRYTAVEETLAIHGYSMDAVQGPVAIYTSN